MDKKWGTDIDMEHPPPFIGRAVGYAKAYGMCVVLVE